jgi:hypothetical protein
VRNAENVGRGLRTIQMSDNSPDRTPVLRAILSTLGFVAALFVPISTTNEIAQIIPST